MRTANVLLYSSDLEALTIIIATLGHDVGHKGLNNRYIINSKDGLAIQCNFYSDNDHSVLEMMHCSALFSIVKENSLLDSLCLDDWLSCRKMALDIILATDMGRHFEIVKNYKVTHLHIDLENPEHRLALVKMLIKGADVGHSAKSSELHAKWSERVCEEFFNQGDLEKKHKLPVSMFCDRDTTDFSKVIIT